MLLEISFLHFRNTSLLHTLTQLAIELKLALIIKYECMSQPVSEVWLQLCQLLSHTFSVITFLTHRVYTYIYIYIYGEKKNHYTKDPNCFQGISVEKDFEMSVTELVDYGYITVCIYRSHDSNLWTFLKKS